MPDPNISGPPRPGAGLPSDLRLLSLPEVARALGLSVRFIETRVAAGDLPSCKIGRRRLVREADLRSYLARAAAGGVR